MHKTMSQHKETFSWNISHLAKFSKDFLEIASNNSFLLFSPFFLSLLIALMTNGNKSKIWQEEDQLHGWNRTLFSIRITARSKKLEKYSQPFLVSSVSVHLKNLVCIFFWNLVCIFFWNLVCIFFWNTVCRPALLLTPPLHSPVTCPWQGCHQPSKVSSWPKWDQDKRIATDEGSGRNAEIKNGRNIHDLFLSRLFPLVKNLVCLIIFFWIIVCCPLFCRRHHLSIHRFLVRVRGVTYFPSSWPPEAEIKIKRSQWTITRNGVWSLDKT